jgi:hypothetical protein
VCGGVWVCECVGVCVCVCVCLCVCVALLRACVTGKERETKETERYMQTRKRREGREKR